MNYLIAVLPNRTNAENAYSALEKEGLPTEQINILGNGYKDADEYGFIDPNRQAREGLSPAFDAGACMPRQRMTKLAYWLVPFGFVAGYFFNYLTGIEIFSAIGGIGNRAIGGLLGAASGAFGAYVVGGAVGLTVGSGDALPYHNLLNAGKYFIVVKGTEELTRRATGILRQFEPENLQGYVEQT